MARISADGDYCRKPREGVHHRKDMTAAVALILVISFAGFCTTHLALIAALIPRAPRWRSLLALLPPLAPLAPYWGLKNGLKGVSWLWLTTLSVYAACLIAGYAFGK